MSNRPSPPPSPETSNFASQQRRRPSYSALSDAPAKQATSFHATVLNNSPSSSTGLPATQTQLPSIRSILPNPPPSSATLAQHLSSHRDRERERESGIGLRDPHSVSSSIHSARSAVPPPLSQGPAASSPPSAPAFTYSPPYTSAHPARSHSHHSPRTHPYPLPPHTHSGAVVPDPGPIHGYSRRLSQSALPSSLGLVSPAPPSAATVAVPPHVRLDSASDVYRTGGAGFGGATMIGMGGSDGEDTERMEQPSKKKRRRQALSCTECKRRKIKCDRNQPCLPCTKRGEQAKCQWHIVEPVDKYVSRAEYDDLRTRVDKLEALIIRLGGERTLRDDMTENLASRSTEPRPSVIGRLLPTDGVGLVTVKEESIEGRRSESGGRSPGSRGRRGSFGANDDGRFGPSPNRSDRGHSRSSSGGTSFASEVGDGTGSTTKAYLRGRM